MFQYIDDDGNFIIESGSNAVPVFKVSGSVTLISGSLIPGDASDSALSELGSIEKPFKELYVESASINFVDTSKAVNHADRKVRFSRKDVEDLKQGRSLNEDGIISASGDMHVEGAFKARGRTIIEGETDITGLTRLRGNTHISGALIVKGDMDVEGAFKVNGSTMNDLAESLAYSRELRATGVTSTEFNKLDGYTGDHNDLNYAKDLRATGVTATEFDYLDGVTSNIQTQIDNAGGGGGSVSGNTFATDLKIGRDADNLIDFTTDNQITFRVDRGDGITMKASGEIEAETLDLGNNVIFNEHHNGIAEITFERYFFLSHLSLGSSKFAVSGSGATGIGRSLPENNSMLCVAGNISGSGNMDIGGQTILRGTHGISPTPVVVSGNGVIDARENSHFTPNNNVQITGIRGNGVTGQIVTITALGLNRVTCHHAEAGVAAADRFLFPVNRDQSLRGPTSTQFIFYDAGQNSGWYRIF